MNNRKRARDKERAKLIKKYGYGGYYTKFLAVRKNKEEDKMGVLMDFSKIGKHCKVLSDSTLNNMKKEDIIKYIRSLEHNYNVAVDFNIQQVKNFEMMESRIVEELESMGDLKAVDVVKRGGISHGK